MNDHSRRSLLTGPELLAWIAFRRVCGGGVAAFGGMYLDGGRPVPCYLPDALDGLARTGMLALAEADAWGLQRVVTTSTGRARYVELSAKRHPNPRPVPATATSGCVCGSAISCLLRQAVLLPPALTPRLRTRRVQR